MATFQAVNSVCASVCRMLSEQARLAHQSTNLSDGPLASLRVDTCSLNAAPFNGGTVPDTPHLYLVVYRIQPSAHQRPQPPARGIQRPSRLAVDVHFLLVPWVKPDAAVTANELDILSWAMLQLHRRPLLDRASLTAASSSDPKTVWNMDETIQIASEPISHDALFRLWDCLQPKYRLSAAFVARVLHLEERGGEELGPVLETQFGYRPVTDALTEALP